MPGAWGLQRAMKASQGGLGFFFSGAAGGNSIRLHCAGGNYGDEWNGRKTTPGGLGGVFIWGSLPRPRFGSGSGKKTFWRGDKVPGRTQGMAERRRKLSVREEKAGGKASKPRFFWGDEDSGEKRESARAPTHPRPSCSMVRRRSETGESSS